MRRVLPLVPAFALVAVLIGCGSGNPGPEPMPKAAGPKAGAKTSTVEVAEVSFEALDAALKEQRGTVVLVDFWAIWCVPCVKGFPHFVELHKKHADRGLTCISVSMDKQGVPEEYGKDKVLAFLKDKGATFPNFIVADPDRDAEKLREHYGKGPGIPFTVLFDREGNRVGDTRPDNPERLTREQLDKKVEEALAK